MIGGGSASQSSYHVYGADAMIVEGSHMLCLVSHCQDAPMHSRVQCFDAAWSMTDGFSCRRVHG